MKRINKYILLTGIFIITKIAIGQPSGNGGSTNVPSPNASSMGTFTNIPVSYYTGTPDINIPIGSASEGMLSTSVSINYHPGNLVVGTPSSSIGKGWSLNAGGVISRMVQDQPDDVRDTGSIFINEFDFDDGKNHTQKLAEKDIEPDIYTYFADGLAGKFYFEPGSTQATTIPKSDIIIRATLDIQYNHFGANTYITGSGNIIGFQLINTDGTIYYFGKYQNREAIEKSTLESYKYKDDGNGNLVKDGNEVKKQTISNSWYLLRIEDHNRDNAIDFYYEKEYYSYKTLAENQIEFKNYDRKKSISEDSRNDNGVMHGELCSRNVLSTGSSSNSGFTPSRPYYGTYHNYRTNFVEGVRLIKIETDIDLLEFKYITQRLDVESWSYHPVAKMLDSIIIKPNNQGGTLQLGDNFICKKYALSYEYFQDSKLSISVGNEYLASADKKTIFLKSLQQRSCDNSIIDNPYRFTYHAPDSSDGTPHFPARLNKAVDHFGYYNGADGSNIASVNNNFKEINIPYTSVSMWDKKNNQYITKSKGNANREPNETYSKYGVLTQIKYPTGGLANYEYENHRYSYDKVQNQQVELSFDGCALPTGNCCNLITHEGEYTFDNAKEIEHAYYTLSLSIDDIEPHGGGIDDCDNDGIRRGRIKLSVREKNTNQLKHVKEINIEGYEIFYESFKLPLAQYDYNNNTYIGNGLKPNVAYKFQVEFEGAEGNFTLSVPNVIVEPNKLGCGLRIKSTKVSDGLSQTPNDIIKQYNYNFGNSTESSGIQFAQPQYGVSISHYDYAQIKQGNNDFVTYAGNQSHDMPGGNVYYQRILFSENSFIPLFGFDGTYIGYREVKETTLPNNGTTTYKFKAKRNTAYESAKDFPVVPQQIDLESGQLLKTETYNKNHDLLTETSYKVWDYPLTHVERSHDILKVYDIYTFEKGGIFTSYDINLLVMNKYNINRAYYQIEEVTTVAQGISSTTKYEYDQLNPHAAPKAVVKTNSDGTIDREEFYYAYDVVTDPILHVFQRRNLLNIPIKSESYNIKNGNKILISGKRVEHALFDSVGVKIEPAPTNTRALSCQLYIYVNHEYKGARNVVDNFTGSWQPNDSILRYNVHGDIVESRVVGMEKRIRTYAPNRLLETSTYLNQTNTYKYYAGTRLLKSNVALDGAKMDFQYDQYGRLTHNYSFNSNIHNQIEYHNGNLANGDLPYIKQSTFYTPANSSPVTQKRNIIYFDGIGRELSSIDINGSINNKDLSTLNYYDSLGRVYKVVSFEGNTNGAFLWDAPNASNKREALTKYDNSPLNRVIETSAAGWYPIYNAYEVNTAADAVKNWETGVNYPANQLSKSITITSEGNKTITFTDKFGREILARKTNANESKQNDTYYLYDIKGRVTKVLPPGTTPTDDDLIFTYTYDGEGNKIAFKDPGKQEAINVYNKTGQAVAVQDYSLRSRGKWLIYEYDEYFRNTRTGTVNAQGNNKPNPETVLATEVWSDLYYGSTGIETNKVLSKTVGVFDGFTLLPYTINYGFEYDQYGRLKKSSHTNHLGGISEIDQFKYDFAGNVLGSRTIHQKDAQSAPVTIVNSITIDNQGRKINEYQTINGHTEHLSKSEYDVFERVKKTQLGVSANKALQIVDFSYDVYGHLVGMNASPTTNDLFSIEIGYNTTLGVANANTYTDGKIGTVRWKHKGNDWQNYTYEYDYLGQLTKASYSEQTGQTHVGDYNCEYTYDERGNFKKIKRNGVYKNAAGAYVTTQIDNLSYTYYGNSNKLKKVTDATIGIIVINDPNQTGNNSSGNRGGGGTTLPSGTGGNPLINDVQMKGYHPLEQSKHYEYDNNGNTTYDPSRDIDISYNYFDLPYKIEPRGKNKALEMLYDAEGKLLQKRLIENSVLVSKTDYVGSFFYKNGEQILQTSHATVKNLTTVPVYNYQLNDHLGNTRVVFSDRNNNEKIDSNEVLQLNNFYPYGMSMYGSWIEDINSFNQDENHFLYNGMERVDELDLGLDFTTYRTFDPTIARWFQNDPNSTLLPGYSPYNSMANNPISFDDPNGDIAPALVIAIAAAVVSGTIAGVKSYNNGGSFIGGFARGAAISLVSSALTFGVGQAFGAVSGVLVKEIARAVAHGVVGGAISVVSGGSFGSGFAAGAVSSAIGSATAGWDSFGGQLVSSGVAGGVSSLISGGNFFSGAIQGMAVQTLNHHLHSAAVEDATLANGELEIGLPGSNYGKGQDPMKAKIWIKQAVTSSGTSVTTVEIMLDAPPGTTGYYEIKVNGTLEASKEGFVVSAGGEFETGLRVPGSNDLIGAAAYVRGTVAVQYASGTGRITVNFGDVMLGTKAWLGTMEIKGELNLSQVGRNLANSIKIKEPEVVKHVRERSNMLTNDDWWDWWGHIKEFFQSKSGGWND